MACARVLSFRILPDRENDVTECTTRLDGLQRQAEGYSCRVSFRSAEDPRHIMILTIWDERRHADAFALQAATVACMARIKAVSDEIPIAAGEYDVTGSDPEDLIASHRH